MEGEAGSGTRELEVRQRLAQARRALNPEGLFISGVLEGLILPTGSWSPKQLMFPS